ncbi:XRE family transcriptional regulator [Exiguobacterium sp. Leaf187]|uniref:Helix-turn-helix transcriptional regulator n=1 Tax=Exiguobacterium indicum TaxID=296995 RepID=A0A0V8GIH7_9BACL|nr:MULTISPECIES: helix-turn-helix transcriptional regulator [Exiguobacterium]AHA30690.1 XRE family transcriptional regulator [Exiguobacterium sp. MH3]KQS19929.1 XRE family transcriptional regulator [Exiguobacterium sp. Leaf187]KSU50068.1 XRE family transcriptional regulator [Exiguobacterium enclense]KTR28391.1 XRE family transcriptional regulator [Exiguobacterium indicum]SDB88866.1 Helix-turn-helix domain-containing protein [Exiguobacterium enclense]
MLDHSPYRGYGDRIRILRERAGVTIEQLAERLGVAPYFIRRTELSEVYPTKAYIEALAEALNIDASYLARHIWTGESLKFIMQQKTPLEEMKLAYEQTLGQDGTWVEEQLEERMRLFDLMYDEDVKRIEQTMSATEQRIFHELVDAVMEAGELQRDQAEETFELFEDKLPAMMQLDEYLDRMTEGVSLARSTYYTDYSDRKSRSRYHRK